MKVGTDGILLGAWAPVANAHRVLDIGTGSGLIALMLAQRSRSDCLIDGVELDRDAATQARANVAASPWTSRVNIVENAIQDYQAPRYDLIVSNPPYFVAGQSFSDPARALARHTGALGSRDLLAACHRLLSAAGQVALTLKTPWRDGTTHLVVSPLEIMQRLDVRLVGVVLNAVSGRDRDYYGYGYYYYYSNKQQ